MYLATNEGRDLTAFARIQIGVNGTPGKIEVIRERADAEFSGGRINDSGTIAALIWNAGGRFEPEL